MLPDPKSGPVTVPDVPDLPGRALVPPAGLCHPLWTSQDLAGCDPASGVPIDYAKVTGLEPATSGFGDRRSTF